MAAQKPSIPKGTRDFSPVEMARRNYIFNTIKNVFSLYGYMPIETPAMENLSTLLGKYGEEGDKLLFRILNSGEFLSGVDSELLAGNDSNKLASKISEKGLRYDLTVPFARYVVQHRNDIKFPFKRYQIQPVWRADRPQKGRYREFYQCDADVIGSTSLNNEVELLMIINRVFQRFGINVVVKLNNRKILAGIAEVIGEPDRLVDITVAIDKIEKAGIEAVTAELAEKGLSRESIDLLQPFLEITGSTEVRMEKLASMLASSPIGLKGIEELEYIFRTISDLGLGVKVELDVSLARGLNYYTGAIIEVKATDFPIGSISGGGRYDNLTGIFGMTDISGVGISFGADRIYDVMTALDLFPAGIGETVDILFVNFGGKETSATLALIEKLHDAGISAEMYPDDAKMKKQLTFASETGIPFVGIIGEEELLSGNVTVKDLSTSRQETIPCSGLIQYLRK